MGGPGRDAPGLILPHFPLRAWEGRGDTGTSGWGGVPGPGWVPAPTRMSAPGSVPAQGQVHDLPGPRYPLTS